MSKSFGLVRYGMEQIRYEVVPSTRRKTLGIEVHPDLRVVIRVPPGCPEDVVEARIRRRARWIDRQLERFRRFGPRTPLRHYVAGETHLYLGRQYRLKLTMGDEEGVILKGGMLVVSSPERLSPEQVRSSVSTWYRQRAQKVFSEVVDKCIERFERCGCTRPRIAIRNMQRRWGSFSPTGTMTLNLSLIKASKDCIEYVVMHELCHLKHKHHSPAFYKLLTRLIGDWELRKHKLETSLL